MTSEEFAKWLTLPGNEIWANLEVQEKLPGMNARAMNAAPPVPISYQEPDKEGIGRVTGGGPEELPPVQLRQWHPPVAYLREQNPSVPIMPWPHATLTLTSGGPNTVFRVGIPPEARLVYFTATDPGTFVGKARFVLPLPVTVGTDVNYSPNASIGPIALPIRHWLECEGVAELFVGIEVAQKSVTLNLWQGYGPRT